MCFMISYYYSSLSVNKTHYHPKIKCASGHQDVEPARPSAARTAVRRCVRGVRETWEAGTQLHLATLRTAENAVKTTVNINKES